MNIIYTYTGVDQTNALEELCTKKLTKKSGNIFNKADIIDVNFKREGRMMVVSMLLKGANNTKVTSDAKSEDMYKSLDLAINKLVPQVKKLTKWYRSNSKNRLEHAKLDEDFEEDEEDFDEEDE